jgi:DnaJ-class molecular chaperone
MFKDINEAYSVLSDPDKRKRFDLGGFDPSDPNGGAGFPGGMNIDPSDIFKMFMGGGGPGGFSFGGAPGDDDFFSHFAGGGASRGGRGGRGGMPGGFNFMSGGFSGFGAQPGG